MTTKQQINGNSNIQIKNLTGNLIIGSPQVQAVDAQNGHATAEFACISDKQAKVIMDLIKSIDALDVEQGRETQRPLMFHIANKAAGLTKEQTYKEITVNMYDVALEALHQHIRTRKIKK
jgi:hypothetical protein